MKSPIISGILLSCSFFILSGCDIIGSYERGNSHVITTTRQTGSFDRITLGGNFEITLRKGPAEEVSITTDENLEPLIEVNVSNGELEITSRKKLISAHKSRIEIVYNYIEDIRVYGATLLNNEDVLESDHLSIRMEGAGVIELQLKAAELNTELSGAGLVKFRGYAAVADISMSGAGSLEAFDLETLNCKIDVSGVGSAKINVMKELNASIAGLGGIKYIGNPEKVHKHVTGVGTIKEEGLARDESVI
ncbi:MAG TPA: head GIN domain-containing protein [Cyclobacteriaceae bacterium]|nr:head GIN domain-containing protein [Cyclobacteriaceae bacterium]